MASSVRPGRKRAISAQLFLWEERGWVGGWVGG
jgi:hypothetical protein